MPGTGATRVVEPLQILTNFIDRRGRLQVETHATRCGEQKATGKWRDGVIWYPVLHLFRCSGRGVRDGKIRMETKGVKHSFFESFFGSSVPCRARGYAGPFDRASEG